MRTPLPASKPCRSPYCECDIGKCTHPGFHDARHEPPQRNDPYAYQSDRMYIAGVNDAVARLMEMHSKTNGQHNFYLHAALEIKKLKEENT